VEIHAIALEYLQLPRGDIWLGILTLNVTRQANATEVNIESGRFSTEGVKSMSNINEMVDEFLAQKHIGIAGVSRGGKSPANSIYQKLKREGHTVYAINPNAETIDGDPVYSDVSSTPEKLDGVVIVTSPEHTEQIVHECAEAGIPRVWIHSSVMHGSSITTSALKYGEEHQITMIPGGCPMMFGQNPDIFHKGMCWWMKTTGKLPR
jgi:predicted CoA-binding protein